jgi:hypothetical protein
MKKSYRAHILLSVFLLLSVILCSQASAQSDLSIQSQYPDVIQDQLSVTVVPNIPGPYDHVIITIADYNTNLDSTKISWSVNGKTLQSGIGGKSFEFVMGALGQTSNVKVTIEPTDAPAIIQTITLTPQDLDIAWEAQSYTAPFYKGKALFPTEGDITFVALPNFVTKTGAQINPGNLVYKWTQNGTVLGSKSGFGKNTLLYSGTILSRPVQMMVEVSTLKGDMKARKIITVTPTDTQALLYENNPLMGILFNKSVQGSFTLTAKEGKFEAFPYFFSARARNNADLKYSWQLNNQPLLVPTTQHSMVFRNDADTSGTAQSSVTISDFSKLLQNAKADISLTYKSDSLKTFFDGQ